MQAALDATTLMISKEALDLQSGQVQQKAKSYFNAQFTRSDVRNLKLTFELVTNGPGDFTVIGEATAKMDTAMAQIIGYNKMDLRTTSQVRWGFKALELALALDNTGSMASKNKMVELKAAVKLLFDDAEEELQGAGRHQDRDHSVRHRGQCRNRIRGRALDRLRRHDHQGELGRLRRRPRSAE